MAKLRPSGAYRNTAGFQAATILIPHCPRCGTPMVLRTAKAGRNFGKQFWGCSGYPACKGVVEIG